MMVRFGDGIVWTQKPQVKASQRWFDLIVITCIDFNKYYFAGLVRIWLSVLMNIISNAGDTLLLNDIRYTVIVCVIFNLTI